MDKKAVREAIKEVLLETIRNRVQESYSLSQTAVPVITGNLKRSGKESDIDKGAKILYSAEYASFVERGVLAHYEYVGSFFRKDGSFVKGFNRYIKGREPHNYIKNSLKEAFGRFSHTFDSNLRSKFKRVAWK